MTVAAMDQEFPGRFLYAIRGPDFVDTEAGEMLELTTPGQVAEHLAPAWVRWCHHVHIHSAGLLTWTSACAGSAVGRSSIKNESYSPVSTWSHRTSRA